MQSDSPPIQVNDNFSVADLISGLKLANDIRIPVLEAPITSSSD